MSASYHSTVEEKILRWEQGQQPLFGVQVLTRSTMLCELAGGVGLDAVWIELEHGGASFDTVQSMCIACAAGGAVPVARVPGHERPHILRSLECGARIVVVPMVNDAATARTIVRWGKFAPLGERGFNTGSRGLRYGMYDLVESQAWANEHTHLIAQIETTTAIGNLDEILSVDGISGVLIGPGDLSVSLGVTAQFDHPKLIEAITGVIEKTKAAGKHAGILAGRPLLKIALDAGADLFFCGSDLKAMGQTWKDILGDAHGGFSD